MSGSLLRHRPTRTVSCVRLTALLIFTCSTAVRADASAQELELKFKVTGFLKDVEVRALLNASSPDGRIKDNLQLGSSERDGRGHFEGKLQTTVRDAADTETVFLVGRLVRPDNTLAGWIPLHRYSLGKANRYYAEVGDVAAVRGRQRAFRESFPFSEGFSTGYITPTNLEDVLAATQILIEEGFVKNKSWGELFSAFLQNVSFFKRDPSQVSKMLGYLKTYGKLTDYSAFYRYYTQMLVQLEALGVDGTEVNADQSLQEYIFDELRRLVATEAQATLSVFRHIIEVYRDEKRYRDCVKISTDMFKSILASDPIMKRVTKKRKRSATRDNVLSTMQGATECLQLDFADRAEEGSKLDRKAAAAFHRSEAQEGAASIEEFLELFERIDNESNLFPHRPERLGRSSRVAEITRYYRVFSEGPEG